MCIQIFCNANRTCCHFSSETDFIIGMVSFKIFFFCFDNDASYCVTTAHVGVTIFSIYTIRFILHFVQFVSWFVYVPKCQREEQLFGQFEKLTLAMNTCNVTPIVYSKWKYPSIKNPHTQSNVFSQSIAQCPLHILTWCEYII